MLFKAAERKVSRVGDTLPVYLQQGKEKNYAYLHHGKAMILLWREITELCNEIRLNNKVEYIAGSSRQKHSHPQSMINMTGHDEQLKDGTMYFTQSCKIPIWKEHIHIPHTLRVLQKCRMKRFDA